MFEAVIFDFGGVITESPFEAFNRLEAELSIPLDTIRRINAVNPDTNAWAKFERSEISTEEFDELFGQEAKSVGVTIQGKQVLGCLQGKVRPDMLQALRHISTHYKTGCITNNVRSMPSMGNARDAAVAEAFSLFHEVLESSKLGIRKPDPRIYEMMLSKLGTSASKSIYLDDLGINLKPARGLGMTTIKVESAAPTIEKLESLLERKLR